MNKTRSTSLWRPVLLLGGVVVLLILARFIGVENWLIKFREWIEDLGTAGMFVFVGAYIIGVITVVPSTALTLLAGPIFGPVLGVVLVSIGATLGGGLAFLIARYFARDAVTQWFEDSERFKRLNRLTKSHGSWIVALTRLVPILPYNLMNYAFGLTQVPFWTFMFWSWMCMLPATALYVLGVDVVANALTEGRITGALGGLFLMVIGIYVLLTRYARRKLGS